MIHCEFASFIWYHFMSHLPICWVVLNCLLDLVRQWRSDFLDPRGKKFLVGHASWNLLGFLERIYGT